LFLVYKVVWICVDSHQRITKEAQTRKSKNSTAAKTTEHKDIKHKPKKKKAQRKLDLKGTLKVSQVKVGLAIRKLELW